MLIRIFGTNFSEILVKIDTFSFKKMHLKMPFCLSLNVFIQIMTTYNNLLFENEYITATVKGHSDLQVKT